MGWKTINVVVESRLTLQVPDDLPANGRYSEPSFLQYLMGRATRAMGQVVNARRTDAGVIMAQHSWRREGLD